MDSTAPAEEPTAAQGIVKGDRDMLVRVVHFAEDVYASSLSDTAKECP
jgi:hypothetical protein